MYNAVGKHEGPLRARRNWKKVEPQVSVLYITQAFSNVRSVLPQCNTRLRLLHFLYDIEIIIM